MKNVAYADSMMLDGQPGVGRAMAPVDAPTSANLATILVADDEPAVRDFISSVLKQQGYEVLVAENGRRSLELCKSYQGVIHLLIADVVMPEMNGRELAEQAKVIRPDLKVLFVSGYVDRGLKDGDTANPSYAFLEKPFPAESLLESVESLCPGLANHTH